MFKALSFILIICVTSAQAQLPSDTMFLKAAIQNSIKLYEQSIGGQTALYNGSQYKPPRQTDDEQHPFFESNDWVYGKVIYDYQSYDNVPLLFDISTDKLITENYYNGSEMVLVDQKLLQFNIGSHTFIKMDHKTLPGSGFYELVYDGPSQVIAKKQKIMREILSLQSIEIDFDKRFRYFIYKNGAFFQVRNKSSVLKLFKDKKTSLKQHVKNHKMLFKSNFEQALKLTAAQYDHLNKLP